jgi:2-C-methyl-D-erythritol 2,4-cyclodiphosphate synthase
MAKQPKKQAIESKATTKPEYLIGIGSDDHRIIKSHSLRAKPLILAGKIVSTKYTPIAHSDGDVVYHALTNSMLLAIGSRDIGQHFPDTKPQWANANSADLLKEAFKLVGKKGYEVNNATIMITAGKPRLADHVDDMRRNIAGIIKIDPILIGIGVTTGENLSDHAKGKGINAIAQIMLKKSD